MNTNAKTSRQKKRNAFVSVLLICALLITGIFAFLTATDSKTNRFTIGKIDIDLIENFDTDKDGTIEEGETYINEDPPVVEDILPGQEIIKQPWVENTGNNEAWTYLVVSVPTASIEDMTADTDGVVAISGSDTQIDVKAYAIQTGYITDGTESADTVWAKYLNNNGGMSGMFGDERDTTEYELFELLTNTADEDSDPAYVVGTNSAWTKIGDTYEADGKNVYIYKLAAPLPVEDTTASLFDAVRLSTTVGDAADDINAGSVTFNDTYTPKLTTVSFTSPTVSMTAPALSKGVWVTDGGDTFAPGESLTPMDTILINPETNNVVTFDSTVNSIYSDSASPKLVPATNVPKITGVNTSDSSTLVNSRVMIQRGTTVETYNTNGIDVVNASSSDKNSNEAVVGGNGIPLVESSISNVTGVTTVKAPDTTRYTTAADYSTYYIYGITERFDKWVSSTLRELSDEDLEALPEIMSVDDAVYSTKYNSALAEKLSYWFDIEGDGYIVLRPSIQDNIGTGAKLFLYDTDGTLAEVFTFVIPGDTNGDARVNDIDKAFTVDEIDMGNNYVIPSIAYDINADGVLNEQDKFICDLRAAADGAFDNISLRFVITYDVESEGLHVGDII